jgi:hypothetical protein
MIGRLGDLRGEYSVVGQVDEILSKDDQVPSIRIAPDAPPSPLELNLLRLVLGGLVDSSSLWGMPVSPDDATISGPGLLLTPIAIFR